MSTTLRRIIDMGPGGSIHPGSPADPRFHDNRAYFAETRTPWMRLWADWPTLQPDGDLAPDDPASPGAAALAALDDQIATACADQIKVALMPYRFPAWANGTSELAAQRNTDAEISFAAPDRMTAAAWARYVAAGRDPARANPSRRGLEFRLPDEGVGPGTRWAAFLAFLHDRYHAGRKPSGRWVEAFELVNEPNFQLWPMHGAATSGGDFGPGPLLAHTAVADMLVAAQEISAAAGHTTLLLAPSTADSEQSSRLVTLYDEFTTALLDHLDAIGYVPPPNQAWAHHDYVDVERRLDATRTQTLAAILAGRWAGAQEQGAPAIYITEGGARLSKMRAYYPQEDPLAAQAACLTRAWALHESDTGPGAGVAMLAQYQTYTDPHFDAGLLDAWPSTVKRPAYAAWAALPSRA